MNGQSHRCGWLPLLAAGLLPLVGCGKPDPKHRHLLPEQVKEFGQLYSKHCAGCHGPAGMEKEPPADDPQRSAWAESWKGAGKFGPAPPLNDPIFLAITSDEELRKVLTRGRHGTPMVSFARSEGGPLTQGTPEEPTDQVDIVIKGIRARWASPKPKVPLDELKSAPGTADKERGLKVFAVACAGCHGIDGKSGQRTVKGEDGKEKKVKVGAVNDPAFLALISDQALRRIIITGRPDLGMPNFAESAGRPASFKALTGQDVADLTALLTSWRRPLQASAK